MWVLLDFLMSTEFKLGSSFSELHPLWTTRRTVDGDDVIVVQQPSVHM